MRIVVESCGLKFEVKIPESGIPYIAYFGMGESAADNVLDVRTHASLLEMHTLGSDINEHHGSRHTNTYPGASLKYKSHSITENNTGKLLIIDLENDDLAASVYYQFYKESSALRAWTVVTNHSKCDIIIDYITSFCLYNLTAGWQCDWEDNAYFYIPYNTWHGEMQWKCASASDLGLLHLQTSSLRRLSVSQSGSWSSGEYLPIGVLENKSDKTAIFWQIEHNGAWYWESSDVKYQGLYLQLCGPTGDAHQFEKILKPDRSFTSVPVTVGFAENGFSGAMQNLTKCRRAIYRRCNDIEKLPIIFNDYMNCLMGDPCEEKCLPLIDAAADIGCEYYVMDAGWFSNLEGGDDSWWSSLGAFEESKKRFPNGLKYIMDYVRSRGLIPGLWIEIETIGAECPLVNSFPDDWFFCRAGKRVMEHGRYQFDFRNLQVFEYALNKVNRIINDYNIGYLKMDYNVNFGLGTDLYSDSLGEGLLEHNRAFLRWLDTLVDMNKDLVIENCASGGMRMDYAMLSRLSIQSTSDQTDWRLYSAISSMAATACTPEQGAVWSYPAIEDSEEVVVYNMVNSILARVHQSGFLNKLPDISYQRVKEGLDYYKQLRTHIPTALPFWPLGIIKLRSPWASYGLDNGNTVYIAVWRMNGDNRKVKLDVEQIKNKDVAVSCAYPNNLPVEIEVDTENGALYVELENKYTARLLKIVINQK